MTKEEILKGVNFDLEKAKEVSKWLNPRNSSKSKKKAKSSSKESKEPEMEEPKDPMMSTVQYYLNLTQKFSNLSLELANQAKVSLEEPEPATKDEFKIPIYTVID